jgi:hypothetical protein
MTNKRDWLATMRQSTDVAGSHAGQVIGRGVIPLYASTQGASQAGNFRKDLVAYLKKG